MYGAITIEGTGFSPKASADSVRIDSLYARVLSATRTRLRVAAPPDPGGVLSVQTPNGVAQGKRITITGVPNQPRIDLATKTEKSGLRAEGSLAAAAGVTALSGLVETNKGKPLAGVTLSITNAWSQTGTTTTTNSKGRFLLTDLSSGHQSLTIDGSHLPDGADYGVYGEPVELPEGQTTALPWTTYLTPIVKPSLTLPSPTVKEVTLTTSQIPGLQVRIPAGTVIRNRSGKVVRSLSITPLATNRTPFPWGPGMVPKYFTIQPGDATVSGPGLQVIYPNSAGRPAGEAVSYLAENPSWPGTGWYVYGKGHVSANGRQIIPTASTRYSSTDPGGAATEGSPTTGPQPGTNCKCGDPVDLETGLLTESSTDISLPDIAGVTFSRTYRQLDETVRDFGMGGSDSLDLYVVATNSGDYNLILPDGGAVSYSPTSATGVYDANPTGTEYDGSVLTQGNGDPDGPFTLLLKSGTTLTFGDPAYLTSLTDRFGNTITINRTGGDNGQIQSVVTSSGRWLQFTYGPCADAYTDCVASIEDDAGRTVSYTYDSYGRLLTVTDPDGGVTTNTWYPCTNSMTCTELESTADPLGRTTTFQYDPNTGEVTQETQPNGGIWTYQYTFDDNGDPTQTVVTDPRGEETSVDFSTSGYPVSTTIGYGTSLAETSTDTYEPNSGLLASTTDALGRETDYTYDDLGNILSETKLAGTPQAKTTSYTYDPLYNRLTSTTDPLGNTTTVSYNDGERTVTTTNPLGHSSVSKLNAEGLVVSTKDARGDTTYYSYLDGDLVAVGDPLGNVSSTYYDTVGRPLETTDAEGDTTTYTYDGLGDKLTSTDPLGNVTSWKYDADQEVVSTSDPNGDTMKYTYDDIGDKLTTKTGAGLAQCAHCGGHRD